MTYDSIHHPIIGIDLGTTYSVISRWDGNKADVYCPKGEYLVPSAVFYDKGKFIVGKAAKDRGIMFPENLCIGVKRHMDYKDIKIQIGDSTFTPIELSAEILSHVYTNVVNMFPEDEFNSEGVVITVPYYFRANQISNTEAAAKKAGLNVIGVLQEPIAAAFAYGLYLDSSEGKDENILVFDLGGGTFDVTIFNLKIDDTRICFNTLASNGDDRLGGLDFDNEIYNYILKRENLDFSDLPEKQQNICKSKLMEQVVGAKERLAFDEVAYIQAIDIPPGNFLECTLTLDELNSCLKHYCDKIRDILKDAISFANLTPEDIHKVIKIGGSSKMLIMDEILGEIAGKGKIYGDIDPDLAVSKGASIYGAFLNNRMGTRKDIDIKLINTHPLGVKTDGDEFVELIPKNVPLPYEQTLTFVNAEDNEIDMEIEVYQGIHDLCSKNKKIGTIEIKGLKPAPKETLDIDITFKINIDQTIDVTVVQKDSGINVTKRF